MRQKIETLAAVALFRSLDANKIQLLNTQCSWRQVPQNQWIIDHEDTSNDVIFVVSGVAHVKLQSISGREVMLREIKAGEFFGELAAIDNQPRSAGIVAVTNVTIARMSASVFRATIHAHPAVCDQLLARLSAEIRKLANRINEFTTLDARFRLYAELLRLARPAVGGRKDAVISPPPVHAEIAARISSRREAVARELKALERSGLVQRRQGSLVLTDPDRLRDMIDRAVEPD
jgi:CRP/FNR family transcriptional regulator, cyclic AMP receptor protein